MHTHALPTPARRGTTRPGSRRATLRPVPHRALRRILTALALTGAVLLGLSPTAYAHDTLTDSSPAEGETLQEAPTQVRLTFSGEVLEMGAAVVVADSDGGSWEADEPLVEGKEVTVPLEDGMPNGDYEINWRVTSSDGHPISGAIPFTVDTPAEESESAPADQAPATGTETPPETQEPATDPAPTTSAASPETTSDETDSDGTASEQEAGSDGGGIPWVPIAVVLGVALVAYAVARVVRRGAADRGGH